MSAQAAPVHDQTHITQQIRDLALKGGGDVVAGLLAVVRQVDDPSDAEGSERAPKHAEVGAVERLEAGRVVQDKVDYEGNEHGNIGDDAHDHDAS